VNQNQGAESTLAFLMALVEMRLLQRETGDDLFAVRADKALIAIHE
jgi:hypothetical protein